MSELKWFLIAIIVLWVLWAATGGPENEASKTRPFIEAPAPVEGGRIYTLEELKDRTRP